MKKSTTKEIQERFDKDVERFSNLETGQTSTIDAALSLELITETARCINPHAYELLDIGCGAGNYTIKMLEKLPELNCTMVDLSKPMLDKALERVKQKTGKTHNIIQGDIREIDFTGFSFDIIVAGAVLHHLRDDHDWETTFSKLYELLNPGGCLFISDLISQDNPLIQELMWAKYGDYLISSGGKEYQEKVFAYIEKEDSPRSITYQINLMKHVGFATVEVLHKNICFGTFCAIK